jgi:hypothetical protein
MDTLTPSTLDGAALEAWRSYLQSHASIVRVLDAELVAEHGMTSRDYEVLLYLAQAEGRHLPMSALAERTMLTRSGRLAGSSGSPAPTTPECPTPS